jgi:uncharacterized protein (DUF58 family)
VATPRDPGRRRGSALRVGPPASDAWPAGLLARLRRALRPPRRLRPTRAGWLFFGLVFGVGFAALNTGNNLLYLVLSLMLAFLVLSGVLSEAALRGIRVERRLPFELVAGVGARVVLEVTNAQRRAWAHAIVVEDLGQAPGAARDTVLGRVFAMLVAPGATETRSYRLMPEARGELAFRGFRVVTRFPFGLFAKSLSIDRASTVVVYPCLAPQRPPADRIAARRALHAGGGRGAEDTEVAGLREYARGDPPRRIHWRASWRRGLLLVRATEGTASGEAVVSLRTRGAIAGDAFEREVERAASEAEAGLRAGLRVALRTDSAAFDAARGAAHRARLLGYLALVAPDRDAGSSP